MSQLASKGPYTIVGRGYDPKLACQEWGGLNEGIGEVRVCGPTPDQSQRRTFIQGLFTAGSDWSEKDAGMVLRFQFSSFLLSL